MTASVALILDEIRVLYGCTTAVDGVTLVVRRGEIVGLLGPNGSGKSTTLAVAAGVLASATGTVAIAGIRQQSEPEAYALQVGLVPQQPALYEELTAEANLRFFVRMYGFAGKELTSRVDRGLTFARLSDRRRDRVGTFSGGLKQRLNLAIALLHDPMVLLLDEPTAALDPASRDALFAELHELKDQGHAILLTTHHLDEAEEGCDRIAVLDRGRITASGRPADLVRSRPTGKAVLYAHLRERLPKFFLRGLRRRIGPGVQVEITGRRLRIAANTQDDLGRALGIVLADGVSLDSFRSSAGRLDYLLRGEPVEEAPVAIPASPPVVPMPLPPPGRDAA